MKHYSIVFLLAFLMSITGIAQQNENYELEKVSSDRAYFNFLENQNTLYIGTSTGSILIDKNNDIKYDVQLIGYLSVENNKVISNGSNFGHIIDEKDENKYNYLLPVQYKSQISRHINFNNKLYIINNNKLFVFTKSNFSITYDSLSVRTITPNYIGSYHGIIKNGTAIPNLTYTDGYIREFGNETFICYEGLYRDSAGIVTVYVTPKDKEVLIGKAELGSARDIIKIENGNYLLLTTKGIFKVNFSTLIVEPIYKSTFNDEKISFIKTEISNNRTSRLFYTANNKINYYVLQSKETFTLIDTKENTISQANFPNTIDKIYVLMDKKMSLFSLDTKTRKYNENILVSDLNLTHNFLFKDDYIFISSNIGLHMFNIKSNKFYSNIVPFETNNLSLSQVNDTVKVGTINGIVNLSKDNINDIVHDYIDKSKSSESNSNNLSIYLIVFLIIVIAFLITFNFKLRKNSKKVIVEDATLIATKENIVAYINKNIITVSNKSICDVFDISPVKLYELLDDEKPGEIIRKLRTDLVRKYRKEKKDEQYISENTGFSISYLKKIY